jgi:acyl-CoA synthetase (AMP-forming)/AMP-acid ligase II
VTFNLAEAHEAVAAAVPERACLLWGQRRLSWAQMTERSRRLGQLLRSRGHGVRSERAGLAPWQSGQDHVALYLHNGNEYLEGMLGAFKARCAPFNVNYRYVADELLYLLRDADARAVIFHGRFAASLAAVLPQLPQLRTLLQVRDETDAPLLPGAVEYEAALAAASPEPPQGLSPDDLYILYTGGTTGMPKGVLWRQADIFLAALGGRRSGGEPIASLQELAERALLGGERVLPAPPMMHGAAHWVAFNAWAAGHTVVIQDRPAHFDADDVLATIAREQVTRLLVVGDAFARPLLDELRGGRHEVACLKFLLSSGAALGEDLKRALLEELPSLTIVDALGASETGPQGHNVSTREATARGGRFVPGPNACVLDEDLGRVLAPGHQGLGWFAQRGPVPLGYLGDPDKTQRTFPSLAGVRHAVPGDRARHLANGEIELHGRDSVTINSGGEKIFAEEVEAALKRHPDVYDAVVCGRPSPRWGQEVCAVVQARAGTAPSREVLLDECARHLARFKLPKHFVFVERVVRSPSGKADYRWAREQVGAT